jgi:hypothetical protein
MDKQNRFARFGNCANRLADYFTRRNACGIVYNENKDSTIYRGMPIQCDSLYRHKYMRMIFAGNTPNIIGTCYSVSIAPKTWGYVSVYGLAYGAVRVADRANLTSITLTLTHDATTAANSRSFIYAVGANYAQFGYGTVVSGKYVGINGRGDSLALIKFDRLFFPDAP